MKILFAENHARFATVAVKTFLADHEVIVVPSIAQACSALGRSEFNVILVDYDLDDGKGTEILQFLALQSKRPFVVAVSSHEAGNLALREAGADEICSKMEFAAIGRVLAGVRLQA